MGAGVLVTLGRGGTAAGWRDWDLSEGKCNHMDWIYWKKRDLKRNHKGSDKVLYN